MEKEMIVHGGEYFDMNKISLDFSVNINPLGCPYKIEQDDLERLIAVYPDRECRALRQKLAIKKAIDYHNVFIGNGASEVITLLCRALDIDLALIFEPTFSGYKRALTVEGINIENGNLSEKDDFELKRESIEIVQDFCEKHKSKEYSKAVFLCNPNNPTGSCIPKEIVHEILKKCMEAGCCLVVDESFMDFVYDSSLFSSMQFLEEYDNLFVISSFTKIFAMPGIRLGALYGKEEIVDKMMKLQPEWSVSGLALEYGLKLLDMDDFVSETKKLIQKEGEYLRAEFNKLGIKTYPSETNFLLCKHNSKDIWNELANRGMLVRRCDNFVTLDNNYFRVAVRKHEDNKKLINELSEII